MDTFGGTMPFLSQSLIQTQELVQRALGAFAPELLLSAGIIFLLLFDLFGKAARPRASAWIAFTVAGLAGLLVLLRQPGQVELFGWMQGEAHMGMLRDDDFAKFFRCFILAATLVTIPMCLMLPAFQNRKMGEFYALLLAATLGMMLMSGATNMLMIYMGIEFASMASYLAVAFLKRDPKGSEAGLKYVIYGSVASGIMIYGMSLLYGMTGSLHLSALADAFTLTSAVSPGLIAASALVFAGFAYKMAAFPMHFWCPDAYEGAPTPLTAYLSVASKAAGFAVFVRFVMAFRSDYSLSISSPSEGVPVFDVGFGWVGLIAGAAALSMTAGNLAALWQTNLKRLLAYSSIAHAGYMLMGVAALRPQVENSGLQFAPIFFYLITYFFMNLAAFYVLTMVASKTGGETLDHFRGLGARAPFLAIMFTLCLVSLLGIPPTGGFTGKLQIFKMAVKADLVWLAVVAGVNTAISAYYYFRVVQAMWLDEAKDRSEVRFAWGHMVIVAVLSAPILVLGLAFQPVAAFVRQFGF